MLKGCDLSHWNSERQYKYVLYFADFFIFKASESISYKDPTTRRRLEECISLGKRTGLYHFWQNTNVERQLDNFLNVYKNYKDTTIAVLDVETKKTNWVDVLRFVNGFHMYTSKHILLYVDDAHYKTMPEVLKVKCKIWIARYNNKLTIKDINRLYPDAIMWQYSNKGTFNDINGGGDLDVNYFFGDSDDWDKLL